ncbi:MAG: hypothetical protein QM669_13920 [Siphonobacter sp.]
MNIRNLLLLAILLVTSLYSFAQQRRLEIPIPSSSANIFTIPVGPDGVLLLTQAGRSSYHIDRFDTNFERTWSVDGTITDGLEYVTYSYDERNVYLLFSRNRSNVYQIIKVYVGPGFTEKFEIQSVDKMEISQFKAFHDGIYIAGVVREQPVLSYTNLQTRQNRLINATFKGQAEVQAIDVDSVTNRVNVTYAIHKGKEYSISVKSFDDEGKQLTDIVVTPDENYALLDGRLSDMNDGTQLMIGTYGYRNSQSQTKGRMVQGLYICRVTENEVLPLNYYSFTDFKNFFSYLSPRDQEKRERQIQRKKERGNDLKINTQILLHDIIQKDNQLILVGEAFQATFRNQNMSPWGFGGPWGGGFGNGFYPGWGWGMYSLNPWYFGNRGLYNNNSQMFDGWQYTNAIVVGFDKNGKLLWDTSFEIDKTKTMNLKEKVKVNIQNDQITLVYNDKGSLRSKTVKNNMVLEDGIAQTIVTGNRADRVRNSTDNVDYWYGNYFLAWGFQRLTNDVDGRRNVFYLNKIAY